MRLLYKPIDALTDFGATLATIALGILVCSLWFEVVARYFFLAPTIWAQSVSVYCALASVMLMLPYLSREGQHVGMSMLFEVLPETVVPWVASFLSLLSALVCAIAAAICLHELVREVHENVLTADNLFIPRWWLTAFMVYGFVFATLHFLRHTATGFVPRGMGG